MQTTITEALAELKIVTKKIENKRRFIGSHLMYPDVMKDPLVKDGGSEKVVKSEFQAIDDLEERWVNIRRSIHDSNGKTVLVIEGRGRTIADWLVWRREIAKQRQQFLQALSNALEQQRKKILTTEGKLIAPGQSSESGKDIVVNISEQWLAQEIEKLDTVLGTLDGKLSLLNATTTVDY